MRLGVLSSMAALLAGTGLAWAQPGPSAPTGPVPSPPPSATPAPAAPNVLPADAGGPTTMDLTPFSHMPLADSPVCPGCAACTEGIWNGDPHHVPHRLWGSVDYILWRIKDTGVPAFGIGTSGGFIFIPTVNTFISTGSFGGSASAIQVAQQVTLPAVFGTAQNAPGNNTVQFGDQPGMRFNLGYWLDSDECFGIDASYFRMWKRTNNFYNSAANPNQGIGTGFADQEVIDLGVIGAAGGQAGSAAPTTVGLSVPVFVAASTQTSLLGTISNETWGMDYNARCRVCYFGCLTLDLLGGFRYLDVDERLNASQNIILTAANVPAAPAFPVQSVVQGVVAGSIATTLNNGISLPASASFMGTTTDFIDAHNRFYGAQFGASFDWRVAGALYVNGFTKIAVGDMRETFNLRGFTSQIVPDAARPNNPGIATTPGGSFVGPLDNNTERHFDRVCLVPQVNLNVGYEITDNIRVHVGYDYIYISAMARPVDQLTRSFSTTALSLGNNTGSLLNNNTQSINIFAPGFKVHNDQSWIYGINMGVDILY